MRKARRFPRKRKIILVRERVDVDPKGTAHHGLAGLYELALRRFTNAIYILTMLPLYLLGASVIGCSLAPGIAVFRYVMAISHDWSPWAQNMAFGASIALGYFLFGFTSILVVPLANFLMRTSPKTFRGPYYSVDFLQWFVHNALTYVVRYTFLEFITPTPFNILFFRLMGMKIGRGTNINTSNISDPALIELGKHVTIGGSATLCAHYGQGGYLVLSPVRIGDGVTIGLKASVMGGVEIGEGAKVLPHSVVLPKTKIGAGEIWGGVPAQRMDLPARKSQAS